MLALIAALIFLAAMFGVHIGSADMVLLGLLFVALHLAFAVPIQFWRRG